MKRKILVSLLAIGLLAVPATVAWAAFDDVTLTTDTRLSVNSITISVSAASAVLEQIVVQSTNFDVTLLSGSSITVRSGDRKVMTHNAASQYVVSDLCASTYSELKFSKSDSGSVTIRVTPSSDTCGQAASVAQVGGSSGGGGIVLSTVSGQPLTAPQYATTSTTVLTPTQTPIAAPQVPTSPTQTVSAVFSRNLSLSSSGEDVMRLQKLLNSDSATQIAASGIGSPGNETTFFGSLTQAAVQRFQTKYGIVSAGTPGTTGYGFVGPKTRAKLSEVFQVQQLVPIPAQPVIQLTFTRALYLGLSDPEVRNLQIALNHDPETLIAESGVGSAGNETTYFGSLTEAAVKKFQVKYGLAKSGDSGYGFVGPKTRAKLNAMTSGL